MHSYSSFKLVLAEIRFFSNYILSGYPDEQLRESRYLTFDIVCTTDHSGLIATII